MVLGHQNLLSNMSGNPPVGLQPALQLAAVAAHLAPRSRPWAPFLQFGMPMFAPFLTRPHFGGPPQHNLLNMSNNTSNSSHSSSLSSQRNLQSPPSEDSNDERGKDKPSEILFVRCKVKMLWSWWKRKILSTKFTIKSFCVIQIDVNINSLDCPLSLTKPA
jgi:hypothetical protein